MLIVPDVQDVYTPLQTDVVVPLSEVGFEPLNVFFIYVFYGSANKWISSIFIYLF